jgi:N-methylhydantoinase A
MRYIGQGWEIPVPLDSGLIAKPNAEKFLAAFERDYAALFGRTVTGLDTEITVWAANATTKVKAAGKVHPGPAATPAKRAGTRHLFDATAGGVVSAAVYKRNQLAPGSHIAGPAVITEAETTIILPTGFEATLRSDHTIDITRSAAGASS